MSSGDLHPLIFRGTQLRFEMAGITRTIGWTCPATLNPHFHKAVLYIVQIDITAICREVAIGIVAIAVKAIALILVQTVGRVIAGNRNRWLAVPAIGLVIAADRAKLARGYIAVAILDIVGCALQIMCQSRGSACSTTGDFQSGAFSLTTPFKVTKIALAYYASLYGTCHPIRRDRYSFDPF